VLLSRAGLFRRAIWLSACVLVILITAPWHGGDGAISVWLLLSALAVPMGLFVPALYSYFDLSRFPILSWWPVPLIAIVAIGYAQWFVLAPHLIRGMTSNKRLERP